MNTLESLFTEAVHDVMVSDKFSKPVVAQYTKNQEQGWGGIYTLTIDGVAHRGVYAEKMEYFADVLKCIIMIQTKEKYYGKATGRLHPGSTCRS